MAARATPPAATTTATAAMIAGFEGWYLIAFIPITSSFR
jgi:hypothetical protein